LGLGNKASASAASIAAATELALVEKPATAEEVEKEPVPKSKGRAGFVRY